MKALAARLGPLALVALVALGVGYWLGVRRAPARIEEKSHTEDKRQISLVGDTKVAEKIGEKTDKKVRREHVAVRPDGTVSSVTVTTSDTTKDRQEDRQQSSTMKVDETRSLTLDKLTIKTSQRDWRVSALVGGSLVNPLTNNGNPFGRIAYGLHAERRVIGPVWIGLWGLGVGDARTWYAGASLGVEF